MEGMNTPQHGYLEPHLSRLENIATRWSLLQAAGNLGSSSVVDARNVLVLRYARPIRAYIRAIVRDEDAADELAQEAVMRFLQGDFAGADPHRGRFRDLLKTALRNLVRNHWRRSAVRKTAELNFDLPTEADPADDPWLPACRDHLLEVAWSALEAREKKDPRSHPYTVLQLRTSYPDEDSTALAARLSTQLGQTIRADTYRQQLKRARDAFADALLRELADGLDAPTPERIHDEVMALDLYPWLKDHLDP